MRPERHRRHRPPGDEVGGAHGDVLVAPHEHLVGSDVTGPGAADQFASSSRRGLRDQPYPVHRRGRRFPAEPVSPRPRLRPVRCRGDHRPRLPPLERRRPARRRRGGRLDHPDADGREYLDAAGGRSSSTSAMGVARSPPRWRTRPAVSRTPTAARSRPSRSRRTPRGRPAPAARRPGDLPGLGRLGGDRDRPQAGPRLPPRPRRGGPLDRLRAVGELPRQHASARSTCPGASRCAGRTRAGSGGSGTCRRPTRTGPASRARTPWARAEDSPPSSTALSTAAGPGHRRRLRRRADRRGHARGRRPARRLLAGDRRRLPPPRRAAHRRRGHDRVRADRPLVRAGPLGRPPGHPRRGQGRDRRATGRSGSWRRRPGLRRRTRARAFVHGFTYSHAPVGPRSPARCCASSRRSARRGERGQGRRLGRCSQDAFGDHPAVGEIRGRGLMVGIELVADRETREPFPRAARVTEASSGRPASAACWSTRGPATPMASTATRSCSDRRSWSPTRSWTDRASWRSRSRWPRSADAAAHR